MGVGGYYGSISLPSHVVFFISPPHVEFSSLGEISHGGAPIISVATYCNYYFCRLHLDGAVGGRTIRLSESLSSGS